MRWGRNQQDRDKEERRAAAEASEVVTESPKEDRAPFNLTRRMWDMRKVRPTDLRSNR